MTGPRSFTLACAVIMFAGGTAAGSVVIDMPAPPPGTMGSPQTTYEAHQRGEVAPVGLGRMALSRYSHGGYLPQGTSGCSWGGSVGFWSVSTWGTPRFGSRFGGWGGYRYASTWPGYGRPWCGGGYPYSFFGHGFHRGFHRVSGSVSADLTS